MAKSTTTEAPAEVIVPEPAPVASYWQTLLNSASKDQQFRLNEWLTANHKGTDPATITESTVEGWFNGDPSLTGVMAQIMGPINALRQQQQDEGLAKQLGAIVRPQQANYVSSLLTSDAATHEALATVVAKMEDVEINSGDYDRLTVTTIIDGFKRRAWRLELDATPTRWLGRAREATREEGNEEAPAEENSTRVDPNSDAAEAPF